MILPRKMGEVCVLLVSLGLFQCGTVEVNVGAYAPEAGRPNGPDTPRDGAPADDASADASSAGLYLEAEDGKLSGFGIFDDSRASQVKALRAPSDTPSSADLEPGPAQASYSFRLERAGEYVIWGRIRSLDAEHNRFWYALDGGPFRKWRITVGDIWYWDDFHDDTDYGTAQRFELEAGGHELVLASAVPDVQLDRLYISAQGDRPPGDSTACEPPHSIEIMRECLPSCGAQLGRSCGTDTCVGRPLVAAYDCEICCLDP